MCNPTPWISAFSGFSAVSDMHSLSRATLHSRGSFQLLNVSDVFRGGSEMVWWNLRWFPYEMDFLIHQYLIRSLRSCFRGFWVLKPWCPCGGLVVFSSLIYLGQRGSKILIGTSPRLQTMFCEFFYLPYCFVFFLWRRSTQDLVPSLWRYYFGIRLSSSLWRGLEN